MANLTVIILTKNEEKNIEKCINSFRGIAERFVIVDSFSEDNTKMICKSLSNRNNIDFYENKFINHANQFNWALDNTNINTEWIMKIDADEELTSELVNEIETRLDYMDKKISGIKLKYRNYFLGKWIKHGGVYPTYIMRIFRNKKAICENKDMDEHIVLLEGESLNFKSDFIHKDNKNLDTWINKHNWYSNKEVIDYYNKKELLSSKNVKMSLFGTQVERKRWLKNKLYFKTPLLLRANWYFTYRYIFKLGFLDGKEGLIFHFLQAYWYRFLVDAKICEIEQIKLESEKKSLKY